MEATLIRIGPSLEKRVSQRSSPALTRRAKIEDPRTYEFSCLWAGDPVLLQELIFARVDWGPFEILCERSDGNYADHCRCEVRYNGPAREQQYLMTSFWGLMETFAPFK